jgi:hypothetical protein
MAEKGQSAERGQTSEPGLQQRQSFGVVEGPRVLAVDACRLNAVADAAFLPPRQRHFLPSYCLVIPSQHETRDGARADEGANLAREQTFIFARPFHIACAERAR